MNARARRQSAWHSMTVMGGLLLEIESGDARDVARMAGFWGRIGAFVIDVLVLALVAGALFWLWPTQVVALGSAGRWVGFGIALLYFGLLNSRLGDGRTVGKRVMGLRVVGPAGQPISVPRALARQTVLGLPFFMNGAWLPAVFQTSMPLLALVALIVFGGSFATYYLYLCNRRSRQSLHDLAVRTWVVRDAPVGGAPSAAPPWRGHWVPVGIIALAALVSPMLLTSLAKAAPLVDLSAAAQRLLAEPGVRGAQVIIRQTWGTAQGSDKQLVAVVQVTGASHIHQALAQRLVDRMVAAYPDAASYPTRIVQLQWGFDLGLLAWSQQQRFQFAAPPPQA